MAPKPPTIAERRAGITGTKPQTIAQRRAGVGTPSKPPTIEERRLLEQYGTISGGREFEQIQRDVQVQQKQLEDTTSKVKEEIKSAEERIKREIERERAARTDRDADRAYEKQVYYKEYLRRLKELIPRLEQGALIEFKDIKNYARDYARYEQDLERASIKQKQAKEAAKKQAEKAKEERIQEMVKWEMENKGYRLDFDVNTLEVKGVKDYSGQPVSLPGQKPKEVAPVTMPSKLTKDFQVMGAGAQLLGPNFVPSEIPSYTSPKQKILSTAAVPVRTVRKIAESTEDFFRTALLSPRDKEEAKAKGFVMPGLGLAGTRISPEKKVTVIEEQYGTISNMGLSKEKPFYAKKEITVPEREVKTTVGRIPGILGTTTELGVYAVPYLGQALLVSGIASGTEKVIYPEQEAKRMVEDLYTEYKKQEVPEGKELLSKDEFVQAVTPNLEKKIKTQGYVEAGISAGFLGLDTAVRTTRAVKRYKKQKYETNLYKDAKAKYNQLKDISKYQEIKEGPRGDIAVGSNLDDIYRFYNVPSNIKNSVVDVKASLSTQKITQKVPVLTKTPVPKGTELAKKTDAVYTVYSVERDLYRNTMSISLKLRDGRTKVYSRSFLTNKEIERFRNLQNALKYSRDNRLIISEVKEGRDIIESGIYRIRGQKIKPESEVYTRVKEVTPDKLKVPDGFKKGRTFVGEAKEAGRIGVGSAEKAELGEQTGLFIGSTLGRDKFSFTRMVTKTKPKVADVSALRKIVKEEARVFREAKPLKQKRGLIDLGVIRKETPRTTPKKPKEIFSGRTTLLKETKTIPETAKVQIAKQVTSFPSPSRTKMARPKVTRAEAGNIFLAVTRGLSQTTNLLKQDKSLIQESRLGKAQMNRQAIDTISTTDFKQDTLSFTDTTQAIDTTSYTTSKITTDFRFDGIYTPTGTTTTTIERPKDPGVSTKIDLRLKPKRPKFKKEEPYDAYVRRDATNFTKARWEKINRIPLTKESALGLAAKKVDNDISARFKIEKRPPIVTRVSKDGKVVEKTKKRLGAYEVEEKNYFKQNKHKFRGFFQESGKRKKLPGKQYIEKQKYRLDSAGEKRGISVGRVKF